MILERPYGSFRRVGSVIVGRDKLRIDSLLREVCNQCRRSLVVGDMDSRLGATVGKFLINGTVCG